VTSHTGGPVRFLSASRAGDLCYAYDGELWLRPAGAGDSRRLTITTAADDAGRAVKPTDVSSQITEFDVSPDGSEIAFVSRGEIFVASTEHGDTRRITTTPEQERSVSFSPDGRSLLYASERGQSWKIYRTDLTDKNEPNFFNATGFKEMPVIEGTAEAFQPSFSPDGSQIAYLEERTTLKVLDVKSGKSRIVLPGDKNYSYSDGDQAYEWSPDGRWLAVQFLSPGRWSSEVGLVSASGDNKVIDISKSGYEDELPHWSRKGEVLYWDSDRQGLRTQSNNGRQSDVYAAYLTHAAWDRYKLDEAAYDQLTAKEKDGDKDKGKDAAKDKSAKPAKEGPKLAEPVAMDFDHIEDRIARLSFSSSDLGADALTDDGENLYFLARYDKGYDLWKYVPRKKDIKLVSKFGAQSANLKLGNKGKKAYVLHDGKLSVVDLDSEKASGVDLSAKMDLDVAQERAYMFEHIWRQTLKKFLDVKMHGTDWQALKTEYGRFLPYIGNDRDFAELCSEMQGELNASHTGCRFRPTRPDGDNTAALGFFPDPKHTGPGVRVLEVLDGGPLKKAGTKVKAGDRDHRHRRRHDRRERQLVPAPESQGGHAGAAVPAGWRHALGRDREADLVERPVAAPLPALVARQPRRGGEALRRPARLRAHPRHERRPLSRDLQRHLRPRHREGRHRPRHAVQRRRQPGRGTHRVPERTRVREERAARAVPGFGAVDALEQAVDRGDERGQLLGRPLLPDGVHAARHRRDRGHAGAGHVQLGVVGAAPEPRPGVRHPRGGDLRRRRRHHGEQAARAELRSHPRSGARGVRARPAAGEGGRGAAVEAAEEVMREESSAYQVRRSGWASVLNTTSLPACTGEGLNRR
jgi:WD40 repeat protein